MQLPEFLRAEGATPNDWTLDATLAGIGIVLIQVPYVIGYPLVFEKATEAGVALLAILGVLTFLPIIMRRHYPTVFFGLVIVMILAQIGALAVPNPSWLVIVLAAHDVARWAAQRTAFICLIFSIATILIGLMAWLLKMWDAPHQFVIVILTAVTGIGAVSTAYAAGRRVDDVSTARALQMQAEMEAAEHKLAEQAATQRNLESQIRSSIARELHDIVAHSISIMVVQAEGGLAQINQSPLRAQAALMTVSDTGREALQEMRRIVHMLRSDTDDPTNMASTPRIAEIPGLIENAKARLTVSGNPHGLTPIIEMTVYRVIQEALTNSLKHAGQYANPIVSITWEPAQVSVVVTNIITSYPSPSDNQGTGLIGMAERVHALDGTLTTGPTQTGEFQVCAKIPIEPSPPSQPSRPSLLRRRLE